MPRRRLRAPTAEATFAVVGFAGVLAISFAVVLASVRGHSFLAPVLRRNPPGWLLWPFGGLWRDRTQPRFGLQYELLAALVAMIACWALATGYARFVSRTVVWATVGAAYLIFFLSPPLLLTDVFNYVDYARMGAVHGLNPYTTLPIHNSHDVLVYHLSNWHHLPSPYGPLFTLLHYPLALLGVPAEYWGYKAILLVASLLALWLVARIARQLGHDPRPAVVLVGLNPIVLVFGAGGQHMDMLLIVLVLAAVTLALDRRDAGSAFAIVAAVAMKASAAVFLPVVIAGSRNRPRALAGAAVGAIVFGGATLIAFGPHLPAVAKQSKLVTPFSIPNVIGFAAGRGGEDATVRQAMELVLALATLGCTIWAWRAREVLRPLGWLTVAVLFTLGWDMAWYVLWLLPFIALVRDRVFRVAAVAVCAWLTLQWLPLEPTAAHQLGFTPHGTHQSKLNSLYTRSLLK